MAPATLLAVSAIGNDRPGIVATVTKVLFERGCNLEDVSSTILRGHFSMMLIVRAPTDVLPDDLEADLTSSCAPLGVTVTVGAVEETDTTVTEPTHMVSVYGADQPGIVFRVAEVLARAGVNITDLTSRVIGSDEEPIYALLLEVVLTDEPSVRQALSSLGNELGVDVSIHPIERDVL